MADNIKIAKRLIRPITDSIGVSDHIRTAIVQARLTGERIKFSLQGRPEPGDAILLIGSGRSGTTWLSSIITASPGVQEIFEPLNPRWVEGARRLTGWNSSGPDNIPTYLRPDGDYPEWYHFLQEILTGRVRSYWTDYVRSSYFPNRFLIKLIRAHLMLGFIYDHFQPKIIYITRHPCAVVNSRLAKNWPADTKDILKQPELIEDHLHSWISDIQAERDRLGAHAVWWAVENVVAQQQLASRPHLRLTYEGLCLKPAESTMQIFDWLGIEMPHSLRNALQQDSRYSRNDITYESNLDRLSVWQRELTTEQQRRILAWAERFGIKTYNTDIAPTFLQEAMYSQ